MKAIVWKELRENAGWAALIAVATLLAHSVAIANANAATLYYSSWSQGLPFSTTTYCPLAALILAFLQVVPELRGDQWAFLMHRPISHGQIFLGKVLAGFVLYFLACGLPLAAALWWCILPGHVAAPMTWAMGLPGLADIFTGFIFYLAALLTVMRPAPIVGSRAMPLAAALLLVQLSSFIPNFFACLATTLALYALLGITAWGSFVNGGAYCPQSRPTKFAVGIILFCGIGFTVVAAVSLLSGTLQLLTTTASLRPSTPYEVDLNGRVLRVIENPGGETVRTDWEGHIITRKQFGFDRSQRLSFTLFRSGRDFERPPSFRRARYFDTVLDYESSREHELWYYRPYARQFEGYSGLTRKPIGFLGPDGFSNANTPSTVEFPYSTQSPLPDPEETHVLTFPTAIYGFSAPDRRVTLLRQANSSTFLEGHQVIGSKYSDDAMVVVLTTHAIEFMDKRGRPICTHKLDYPLNDYPTLEVADTPKRKRFIIWYYQRGSREWDRNSELVEISGEGAFLLHQTIPGVPRSPTSWYVRAAGVLIPPLATASILVRDRLNSWFGPLSDESELNWRSLRRDIGDTALCSSLVLSLLAAALVPLWGRARAWTWRTNARWMTTVFCLGPIALLTLLALHASPARVTCTTCGKRRLVERDLCEHCGAPWPKPTTDGTEIFEERGVLVA